MDHGGWWRCLSRVQVWVVLLDLKVCTLTDCAYASDAIAAHGFAHELANYGEYSGAPTEGQTYEYAKTIGTRDF